MDIGESTMTVKSFSVVLTLGNVEFLKRTFDDYERAVYAATLLSREFLITASETGDYVSVYQTSPEDVPQA